MAIPILLWGAAAGLAATGVVKGVGAKNNMDEAKEIGEKAERRHKRRIKKLNQVRDKTNEKFIQLGELKVSIFNNQIKHIIELLHKSHNKQTNSVLKDFYSTFSVTELKEIESLVATSLELGNNLGSSTIAGALAGFGAYSAVPLFATASTGTAISSLSGAAATNATLAWLGGGSLASGGFGIAGGTLALGGIVAGPALAVAGFMMASKAEKALTKAYEYAADVDEAIGQIDLIEEALHGLQKNADELQYTLQEMLKRFEAVRVDSADDKNFRTMLDTGMALKNLMTIKIMNDDGSPIPNIQRQCEGYLSLTAGEA